MSKTVAQNPTKKQANGFTLLEMSIVLIVIGLIVGGVLVGRDLIAAAAVRGQIAQITSYNNAVSIFISKYGFLPGDLPDPMATNYGFKPRSASNCNSYQPPCFGYGNGDGILQSSCGWYSCGNLNLYTYSGGNYQGVGETVQFWVDLSKAALIEGSYTIASVWTLTPVTSGGPTYNITGTSTPALKDFYPMARIGNNNYIFATSGGPTASSISNSYGDGINYFSIQAVSVVSAASPTTSPGLTVSQAYNIDNKIDDGLPQTGSVMAFINGNSVPYWVSGSGQGDAYYGNGGVAGPVTAGSGIQTPATATTCYDNSNVAGGQEKYSTAYAGGYNVNCGLSIKMVAQ